MDSKEADYQGCLQDNVGLVISSLGCKKSVYQFSYVVVILRDIKLMYISCFYMNHECFFDAIKLQAYSPKALATDGGIRRLSARGMRLRR